MKDWRNTLIGTLGGAVVTLTVMFVSTTRIMATQDQLEELATKAEIAAVQQGIKDSMTNQAKSIKPTKIRKEISQLKFSLIGPIREAPAMEPLVM
ncbi:hypothetical protein LCGC14_2593210 [marine sediment metagenome]|uniref:Uncharacterized protein n=1 Tax=marine sediment metagenome TaxID=412755 RepID=A0A0F9ABB9_9ZZZZ